MRLSSILVPILVFGCAAGLSVVAARVTVGVVEHRSVAAVQGAVIDGGHNWASVIGDGLQVILEGEAPSEAARFRSMSIAGGIVDASRVIDNMSVQEAAGLTAPDFAIEILRNDNGVSLIGLLPTDTDRDALNAQITRLANGLPVTDLLEQADYPVPEGWRPAMTFALRALEDLPRSKISVRAGRVQVTAISDSADQKRQLEAALSRRAPPGMTLALSISAPRPVISPYVTRFTLDETGARFDSCVADTPEAQTKIITAATGAGWTGKATCTLALGVPSGTWGDAVALSIGAVKDLGGGTVTISDADIAITALIGTSQTTFDSVIGTLENALPDLFALDATLPAAPSAGDSGPPQFTATLSPEGAVQLRGRVPDELVKSTVDNFAQAKFGKAQVTMGTRIADGLPQGWTVRVLAGIEALAHLKNGSILVEPDRFEVRGNTADPDASAEISRLLVEKLGDGANFSVDVTYVEALDMVLNAPSPEDCIGRIGIVTAERKILFDPGSATLTAETLPVIDDIAEILQQCLEMRIEIAGYTDSQGREEMNQALSQDRANAVLTALRSRRVPVSGFTATGYGEADPIADNDTEDGREANRRIEFRLVVAETPAEEPTTLEQIETNGDADAAATTE